MKAGKYRLKEWHESLTSDEVILGKVYETVWNKFEGESGISLSVDSGSWGPPDEEEIHLDLVYDPSHYQFFEKNTIHLIRRTMTVDEWRGFCLGNALKYRLRVGKKDNLKQEIDKAINYETLYEELK